MIRKSDCNQLEQRTEEAVHFFKSDAVYDKLFRLFRKKYESLGRIGGTVPVTVFSDADLQTLGDFFGKPGAAVARLGTISLMKFEAQLQETRFDGIGLFDLLEAYFGEVIVSKKIQQQQREEQLVDQLSRYREAYPALAFWLEYVEAQPGAVRWFIQLVVEKPEEAERFVQVLTRAVSSLPGEAERLPMFSQRITGDPHAFDLQTDLGRLWIHVLAVAQARQLQTAVLQPVSTEEINELLQYFHLYRDDLLNFVTCANLLAETEVGQPHPVWEAAVAMRTVRIVPLREIVHLATVQPAGDSVVFVVENSGVCSAILDQVPEVPIVCTNGQFTLASWLLLEKLIASGSVMYYAGDFDPEGLLIADRLVARFGADTVKLWQMDVAAYRISKSQKSLSAERLEKLQGVQHPELLEVAEKMRQLEMAGYQEALVTKMVADIRADLI